IASSTRCSRQLDRTFPVRERGGHPGPWLGGPGLDVDAMIGHSHLPLCRHVAPVRLAGTSDLAELDLRLLQRLRAPVRRDPGAGAVGCAIPLAHLEQHELGTICQMQRKPVPSFLGCGKGLAAPFTIEPGLSADAVALAMLHDFTAD